MSLCGGVHTAQNLRLIPLPMSWDTTPIFTVRNVHLSVILFTGGRCLADTPLPPGRHLPGQTPPGQTTPRQIPPYRQNHPLQETATAADVTHPTGMFSCIGVCLDFVLCQCEHTVNCASFCRRCNKHIYKISQN